MSASRKSPVHPPALLERLTLLRRQRAQPRAPRPGRQAAVKSRAEPSGDVAAPERDLAFPARGSWPSPSSAKVTRLRSGLFELGKTKCGVRSKRDARFF